MRKHILILFLALSTVSCGVVRQRNSPIYHSGPPYKAGYEQQGIVEEVQQPCSVPGPTMRRMIVYLPPDYYAQPERRYPVFYLLHGARGYETSWIERGRLYEVVDSLWSNNLAVPSIIVLPNVNQYNDDEDFDNSRYKDAFESILEVNGVAESAFVHDVVQLVDSLYRTIPDKNHRAVAGLSIGGCQSIWLGMNHPDTFGYIGAFSPYMWGMSLPSPYRRRFYSQRSRKLKAQFADPPKGYYLYAGEWDIMRPSTYRFHQILERENYPHEYYRYPGSHDWKLGWTPEFVHMYQQVFRDETE